MESDDVEPEVSNAARGHKVACFPASMADLLRPNRFASGLTQSNIPGAVADHRTRIAVAYLAFCPLASTAPRRAGPNVSASDALTIAVPQALFACVGSPDGVEGPRLGASVCANARAAERAACRKLKVIVADRTCYTPFTPRCGIWRG